MTDAAELFREAASAAIEDYLRLEPESATNLGDHRYDDRLDDRSADGLSRISSAYKEHKSTISQIDPGSLDAADQVDREMLLGALEMKIFAIDELREFEWNPLFYNAGDSLFPLVARQTVPVPDRLRSIAARLEQIPSVVELARDQLQNAPKVHLETAVAQNSGTLLLVGEEVNRVLQSDLSLAATVTPAQQAARRALEEYGRFLEEKLAASDSAADGGDNFRIGRDRFDRKLNLSLNSDIPAGGVLRRAEDHLDQITVEMEEACRRYLESIGSANGLTGAEAIRRALDVVAESHPDNDTVVDLATSSLEEATSKVRETGIATIPDDAMSVHVMPEFRRGVAVAYCDPPGPLESGGETFLAVAPTPETWPREQADSFYREYNSAMVTNLIVHEAMPGHGLQLAVARRYIGSTPVRRVFWSGSFVEGWAVHAERLMAGAGLGGLAVRISQLKMQLRMTINAILDAGVHAQDMTEEQALELMMGRGFQEMGEASGKWRRACLTSAQLSTYFVGYTELDDLFERLGTRSNYDFALAHGSPPPRLLAKLIKS
ncbi:MAG: DUF885 domain-containing protein [Acidimicrobiales bacterium]|jgi:uncharacterized protein (DUF885 family)